ncbi:slipin family protein [Candidatus Pyrohabitans sp.]
MVDFITLPALIIVALLLLSSAIRVVREYERGVVFRLGRLIGAKGPGIMFLIPLIDRMVKVDLRTVTLDVPSQEIITKDNVTVRVNAVVYFRIIDPEKAIVEVENYLAATSMIAQTTLRSVIGMAELDELLAEREKLNEKLQSVIDQQTDPWGVKVTAVEIKDVEIPQGMQRAMAAQAEAERERRAKIISAQGEYQAAQKLAEAARIMAREPGAMQLRFLQTVREATSERASVFILPVPIELLEPFLRYRERKEGEQ